jgi:hypothetical protein
MEEKRRRARKRSRLRHRLASQQSWLCAWCSQVFPDDLEDVHVDHIIPKASGVLIEDEWNLQLLHRPCNMAKGWRMTDEAWKLASEHGVEGIAAERIGTLHVLSGSRRPEHPKASNRDYRSASA